MRKLIVIALIAACTLAVLAAIAMAATQSVKVGDDYYVRSSGVPKVTVSKGTTVRLQLQRRRQPAHRHRSARAAQFNSGVLEAPAGASCTKRGTYTTLLHDPRRVGPEDEAGRRSRLRAAMSAASSNRKIRVVVAKPGLDGHDRGAKIIARALRDAGMEVIYTGLHQTPEQIVETVLQEDADAVGLSILSGAHMTLVPKVIELLRAQDAGDVVVTVGGTIPAQDIPELKELGVAEVFTPGAPTQAIIDYIQGAVTP